MDKKYVAYVGSYTHESSKGIHIYDCDVAKGRITERGEVAIDNPSFITFSPASNPSMVSKRGTISILISSS